MSKLEQNEKKISIPEFDRKDENSKRLAIARLFADIYARLKETCSDLPAIRDCLSDTKAFERAEKVWKDERFSLAEGETPCDLNEEEGIKKMRENARRREIMGSRESRETRRSSLIREDKLICDASARNFEAFSKLGTEHLEIADSWKELTLDLIKNSEFAEAFAKLRIEHLEIANELGFTPDLIRNPKSAEAFAKLGTEHLKIADKLGFIPDLIRNPKSAEVFAKFGTEHLEIASSWKKLTLDLIKNSEFMEAFAKLRTEHLKIAEIREMIPYLIKNPESAEAFAKLGAEHLKIANEARMIRYLISHPEVTESFAKCPESEIEVHFLPFQTKKEIKELDIGLI